MKNMKNIDEIFRACLQHFRPKFRSTRSMALTLGFAPEYFHQVFKGTRAGAGSDDYRRNVATALGYPGARYEEFLQIGRDKLAGREPRETEPFGISPEDLPPGEFLRVRYSDKMRLAAGTGATVVDYDEDSSPVIVHKGALGQKNYRPSMLQAFKVGGDSMEPLIAKDGIVLVTLQDNIMNIKEGEIYVLCWDRADGECAVKTLRWVEGEKGKLLSIESLNTFYPPKVKRVKDVVLIGRVIWSWREH